MILCQAHIISKYSEALNKGRTEPCRITHVPLKTKILINTTCSVQKRSDFVHGNITEDVPENTMFHVPEKYNVSCARKYDVSAQRHRTTKLVECDHFDEVSMLLTDA